jgi:hypothetical protein
MNYTYQLIICVPFDMTDPELLYRDFIFYGAGSKSFRFF